MQVVDRATVLPGYNTLATADSQTAHHQLSRLGPGTASAWPSDAAPSRARFADFGAFLDERTAGMIEACRTRQMPPLLRHALERCTDHYWLRGDCLGRLRRIRSGRRKRTERRCAHVAVLQFLIARLDLVTMQCVVGERAALRAPSVQEIATRTGLEQRRVERVLQELAQAGYLRTRRRHTRLERADGSLHIVNQIAVRWLTPLLFTDLGLPTSLETQRRVARKHHQERARKAVALPNSALSSHVGETLPRRQGPGARAPYRHARAQSGQSTACDVELRQRAAAIKYEHPEWSRERCYAEARRRLGMPARAG